jgi:hypothetical protein
MKKAFPLFFVSVCFGMLGLVLWTGQAFGKRVSPVTNPPGCQKNLEMCTGDLGTCEDDLAARQAQPTAPVPQTGQTTCWDSAGTILPIDEIPCTDAGAQGEDGQVWAGVVAPDPRFTANVDMNGYGDCTDPGEICDGTVTDNLTGLVWLKEANCVALGPANWATALSNVNSLASGACGLSDGSGVGDWHLPNRNQLTSLFDLEKIDPALPTGHLFMNFQSSCYWSSTTYPRSPDVAWCVDFQSGGLILTSMVPTRFVLPVRGGL